MTSSDPSSATPASPTPTGSPAGDRDISPEVFDALRRLASLCGVATSYTGQDGSAVQVSPATILFALRELGLSVPSRVSELSASLLDATMDAHIATQLRAVIAPTITGTDNAPRSVQAHCEDDQHLRVWLEPEDGSEPIECEQLPSFVEPTVAEGRTFVTSTFSVPAIAAGWHTLRADVYNRGTGDAEPDRSVSATYIVAPQQLSSTKDYVDNPATGVMAQLYSVRHAGAWGIGDYRTLQVLGDSLRQLGGADFVLVNPMHAAEATPPVEDSPYLPTTRRFTNPIYLHIEDIPEYRDNPELQKTIDDLAAPLAPMNSAAALLDRTPIMEAKLQALQLLYSAGLSEQRRSELDEFIDREGEGLEGFVTWCEKQTDGELSADFFAWVQLLCQQQEGQAQRALEEHMRIGLMADLAVGVHPKGADAFTLQDTLAHGASVGAPPDGYNQQGQDWSQPPWHPWRLAEAGYAPWRDMLRTILRTAGGIRIDHILGLFRLWWIPRGELPTEGTYVSYDHEALISALVLEAERAGGVVIGEDLGTFEPWVQEYLASRGVMGTTIVWFEGDENGPKKPETYRQLSLTSVTTHDLPPTASYLQGGHIELRDRLGVLTRPVDEEFADDAQWQSAVLGAIGHAGGFSGYECEEYFVGATSPNVADEVEDPRHGRDRRPGGADGLSGNAAATAGAADTADTAGAVPSSTGIIEGMHAFLSLTPSALRCVALVDMVGDLRAQNQPGTTQELYPNWRIPLCDHSGQAVLAEDLPRYALARDVLDAARGGRR
nr:4-alpha-glucanotransferase [Corynebacterium falsenii]